MAAWSPADGYFGTLLAALFGGATRRVEGNQNSGGGASAGGGTAVTADTALRLSAVWACIKIISEAVGAMPIIVWNINRDGTRTRNIDHWVNKLLAAPNRYQTRNEFFETLIINLLLSGNAYVRKNLLLSRDTIPGSLICMSASQTEVMLLKDGNRVYTFTDGRDAIAIAQENVWHVMAMPSNSIVGLSTLQYGARSMGIAIAAEDRVSTLAANGFKPTGVLMIDRLLKPEQRAQIRGQFNDLQEGKGDPLKVLEAGMKYQQVSMNPKDVQLLETRKFSVEDIARFFGVPSILINDNGAVTAWGTGIGEIKEGFYTLTLQPLLEKLESSFRRWIVPATERDKIEIEFDFTTFLRGNESNRVTTLTTAITGKLLTIDEARARFDGLKPLPNGTGAVMYDQSQMIPLGNAGDNAQTAVDQSV